MAKQTIAPEIFDNILQEIKKVEWPTRKEALHLTLVVVILSLIIGIYVGVLDVAFAKLFETILRI
ncbi:MAG: preprotein translocase subunit SecE [Candidatus Roizmanbacteria bacterium]|nr:preprotein translocase subunit SecE [Candidatus Roizmanbacteria bacterium]